MPRPNPHRSHVGIAFDVWLNVAGLFLGAMSIVNPPGPFAWAEAVTCVAMTLLGCIGIGIEMDKPRRPAPEATSPRSLRRDL